MDLFILRRLPRYRFRNPVIDTNSYTAFATMCPDSYLFEIRNSGNMFCINSALLTVRLLCCFRSRGMGLRLDTGGTWRSMDLHAHPSAHLRKLGGFAAPSACTVVLPRDSSRHSRVKQHGGAVPRVVTRSGTAPVLDHVARRGRLVIVLDRPSRRGRLVGIPVGRLPLAMQIKPLKSHVSRRHHDWPVCGYQMPHGLDLPSIPERFWRTRRASAHFGYR
jgi:hypothetical protein